METPTFKRIISLYSIGIIKEFTNGKLMSVRLVKLLSYNEETDEYHFKLDNEFSDEFMTVAGNSYPHHQWKTSPTVYRETRFIGFN